MCLCVFYYGPFHVETCFFFPILFSIVITSLGEERTGLYASHVIICLFCTRLICPFSLPLGVMCWLLPVLVAFPDFPIKRLAFLFVLVLFSVLFSIVFTSLEEERAGHVLLVLLFVYFARINIVPFLFLLVSGVCCDLCLWHSLDFSINLFL